MPSLSYQEKSLYGELLADLAVFLPYFIYIHVHNPTVAFIAATITILIVVQIILQILIAAFTRNRLKDERDRLIRLRGYRAGYFTVISLMLFGMAALWVHTILGQINPAHMALHFLSVFFAVLILAELVKTIVQLIAYRRPL
jgi:uncharacterized membrane protein